MEEEHIVIFDTHSKGCSKQEQVAGDKSRGRAVGAGTGAGAGTRAALAMEAGDTLTDLILPYLMYTPPLRVVRKLRPHGLVSATCRLLVREHGYCYDFLLCVCR